MYLDQRGNVLACCLSHRYPMGNVQDEDLVDIWWGARADRLRAEVAEEPMPTACRQCQWQIDHGGTQAMFARQFDHLGPVDDTDWPRQIEFALSNRCNLQCIMCSGDFSSTIRARREQRPALPQVYDNAFFDQLWPFLERTMHTRFLGGEPFLVPEYARIWDHLAEFAPHVRCDVTTNGTVWNDKVARTLDSLAFTIGISVDGFTRGTVERIRSGADYDELMSNIARFAASCQASGTRLTLTYCLMTVNWQEFPAFSAWARDLGADVAVNTVSWPPYLSVYEQSADEVEAIVAGLQRGAASSPGPVDPVVAAEADRIRDWLQRGGSDLDTARLGTWSPMPVVPVNRTHDSAARLDPPLQAIAQGPVVSVEVDLGDLVTDVSAPELLGTPADQIIGRSYRELIIGLQDDLGNLVLATDGERAGSHQRRLLLFESGERCIRLVADTSERADGSTTALAMVESFPATPSTDSARVTIGRRS